MNLNRGLQHWLIKVRTHRFCGGMVDLPPTSGIKGPASCYGKRPGHSKKVTGERLHSTSTLPLWFSQCLDHTRRVLAHNVHTDYNRSPWRQLVPCMMRPHWTRDTRSGSGARPPWRRSLSITFNYHFLRHCPSPCWEQHVRP